MLATTSPTGMYFDGDGSPLDAGYLYFGVANQNPEIASILVYWDAAGTQPAAQPVRTLNGFTARNGRIAQVYADADYSLTTKDAQRRLVQYMPSAADFTNALALELQIDDAVADAEAYTDTLRTDLAEPTGAGLNGFDLTETYPPDSTGEALQIQVLDSGNVRHYGVDVSNTGAANLTALNALLVNVASAGGGIVTFPPGIFDITGTIAVPGNNTRIQGTGRSVLKQTAMNSKTMVVTADRFQLSDLAIYYDGVGVAGGFALEFGTGGINSKVDRLTIYNAYEGIRYLDSGHDATEIEILNYASTGILTQGVSDVRITNFLLNAGAAINGQLGGLRLVNKAEAVVFTNGSILEGKYSFTTDSAAFAEGNRPAYNKFIGVYFDAAAEGSQIADMIETDFVGCWFSGGRSGAGFDGLSIGRSDTLRFANSSFFNSGYNGCTVAATAKRAQFRQCSFQSNSVTAASGVGRGLEIAAGCTDFIVQGCTAGNGLYTGGRQGYGIVVGAGASDRYVIADNLVSGNLTGGVFDGGTGVDKRVANNY